MDKAISRAGLNYNTDGETQRKLKNHDWCIKGPTDKEGQHEKSERKFIRKMNTIRIKYKH